MAKKNTHHVIPNPKGGWDVKKGGASSSSGHFNTKKEAEEAGRTLARSQRSELVIHRKDGKISERESTKDITIKAFQKAYEAHNRDKAH